MGGRSSVSGLTVTVFGSTGFLGRYVVNKLGQIGTQVICPYRGNEYDAMHLRPLGDLGQINLQSFHLKDYPSIVSAVRNSNVVINLIAQDRETSSRDVHITGALNIAKACAESNVPRLIHVSSASASIESKSVIMKSRGESERIIRKEYPNTVIVRSSTLFGHEDRFLRTIGAFSTLPFGYPVVREGVAKRYPLYVGDLAEGISRIICLNSDIVDGKTFDLFGPTEYSQREIIKIFCYYACRPERIINLSPFFMSLYARLYPEWRRFMFTKDLIQQMEEDEKRVDGSKTWSDIGIESSSLKTLEHNSLPFLRSFRLLENYSTILPPFSAAAANKSFMSIPISVPSIKEHDNNRNINK